MEALPIQVPLETNQESSTISASPQSMVQSLQTIVSNLIAERNQVQEELKYVRLACVELHSQNEQLQQLLCEAHDALPPTENPSHDQNLTSSTWVGGTWLTPSIKIPALVPVQDAWLGGKTQQALALLTEILVQKDLAPYERIEAGLLLSAIMRSSGDLARALTHTEICLRIAEKYELPESVGKSQFHRGLCYFYQDRYADARWCFVLASHTKGHQDLIAINMQMVEEKMKSLPSGHPSAKLNLAF